MSSLQTSFRYTVEDINNSVRKTNILLRGINALRLSIRDIRRTFQEPTMANFFWTLIQIMRTYNALRRLYKITLAEMNKGIKITKMFKTIPMVEPMAIPEVTVSYDMLSSFDVRVETFRENLPIPVQEIDLSELPEESSIMIQAILEEDAEITVEDARQILTERIIYPEQSTGFLAASIGWMPETFGTRIYANAFYAWWVERGQRTFTGHWYMRDATARARLRLPEKIRMQINGLILGEI